MIAAIHDDALARQGSRAGLVSRIVANAVDAIVALLTLIVGYLVFCAVIFIISPRRFSFPAPGRTWSLAIGLSAVVLYLALGWFVTGRTPGKQLAGLRVVSSSGARLSFAVALTRAILYVAFPIGLVWSAFSQRNSSLQDLLLRTVVIYDWRTSPGPPSDLSEIGPLSTEPWRETPAKPDAPMAP